MGISEKLEELSKKADMKDRERARKKIREILSYLESFNVDGLEEILSEIEDIRKSGLYNKLIKAVTMDKFHGDKDFMGELPRYRMLKLAYDNLRMGGLLTTIFTSSFVTVKEILTVYTFIESVYYMNTGRLKQNDILNIYFSGLDECIFFALDKFDQVNSDDLPKPTPEYFQELRKVRWKDKKAKGLYDKLTRLMLEIQDLVCEHTGFTVWNSNYAPTEDVFIQVLSACSAANDGRVEIEAEDVVMAYRTFFKLIKTDVTKYKAIPERIKWLEKQDGYLVCHDCGGYYKLQPGESPNDFSDTCKCGGELRYYEDIDWLFKKKKIQNR